jgi:GNAT superfamily N-acetyltransferase
MASFLTWKRAVHALWWVVTGALAGFGGGAVLALLLYAAHRQTVSETDADIARAALESSALVTLGPPIALLVFVLGTILQVGLMGSYMDEEEREWWGSLNGYVLRSAVVWLLVCGVALFSVPLLLLTSRAVRAALGAAWLTTALGGVFAARSPSTGSGSPRSNRALDALARVAPFVFVLGLGVLLSALLSVLIDHAPSEDVARYYTGMSRTPAQVQEETPVQLRLWSYWAGIFNSTGETDRTEGLMNAEKSRTYLLIRFGIFFIVFIGLALFLSWCVGVNTFSLHWIYGNRLVRCYLGASRPKEEERTDQLQGMPANVGGPERRPNPITGFDPLDDLDLDDLRIGPPLPSEEFDRRRTSDRPYRGPYLLINTALNLVHGDELAWQERKAEAFLLSPVFCGSKGTDYRRLPEYAGGLKLGCAVTISGAAAAPNMGYHSSPAVTALLTLFNVRLGAWLGNPHEDSWQRGEPHLSLFLLAKELFGRTNRRSSYVYLSDGGHFENLGVYELVRRHCRFIVAVDAGQDGQYAFDDLGSLLRKCRSDLGVPIEIDVTPLKPENGHSRWHCAIGQVRYDCLDPQAVPGVLVYLKSSLTGDEPSDIVNYTTQHPDFPHQTTLDQFFTESQFESYRMLGQHVAKQVFGEALEGVDNPLAMTDDDHRRVVRRMFANLSRRWFPPPPKLEEAFLQSVTGYVEVESALRTDANLAHLSQTIYPELKGLEPEKAENEAAQRRAEVHAVNQMLQVMENAWLGIRLDSFAAHPLNRGWMSVFRRWAGSEVFRRRWLTLRGEFSQDFVRFCEQSLGLDRGQVVTQNWAESGRAAAPGWAALAEEFRAEWPGERDLTTLASEARLPDGCETAWLIRVEASRSADGAEPLPCEHTCGVVLVRPHFKEAGEYELLVWVRGAYRNLGIGRACMEALRDRIKGLAGTCKQLRVRFPVTARRAIDRRRIEMWQSFFFNYDFRPNDTGSGMDRILVRDL